MNESLLTRIARMTKKYATFIGPGLVVSVSYMDPGNYSTSVSSGSMYQYKLCFIIFMANVFAIILQALCVKLGTITGLDLAEMCRMNLNPKLNLFMYFCAEIAIIATDLAEVVGTAISLEILFGIPLLYGVLITVLDVLIILMAYQSMALFLSCGIVGSTVMPHSLYLGSALVQPRLKDYDEKHGVLKINDSSEASSISSNHHTRELQPVEASRLRRISDGSLLSRKYKPSYAAIKYCLNYSYVELVLSLFLVAVFVNSAILIVAGSTLFGKPDAADADLLSIYEMLSFYISPAAGLVFALSMLFSGQSAGIVCTMAGQIVSEGFINWTIEPWKRRIVTRVLAILPVIFVVGILGREGVSKVMNSSQVVLSFILPIVSAPLIYFTSKKEYMTVVDTLSETDESSYLLAETPQQKTISFENGTFLRVASILTWVIITALNIYLVIAFANGADL
ncbi:Iron transporter SMF3 [Candida tropicalis]